MLLQLPHVLSALLLLSTSTHAHPFSRTLSERTEDVINCLTNRGVPSSSSSSNGWSTLTEPYNLRLAYVPEVITSPTTAQHITDSVLCAKAGGLKVQARSGGHSYASFSIGGQDGSVIVDLQSFNSIAVDSQTGVATVGGGVRLGNLALGIYAQGERALPHGTCPGVGIGGHATQGGYGHSSRLWGLTLDTIVGLDVVLANGSQIHTTSTKYPDIFYACRGAADSIAIIYTFYFQTVAAPKSIINFAASIPATLKDASTATDAFLKLQTIVLNSSKINNNLSLGIYTDSDGSFSLSGWCISCDLETFNSVTFPLILSGFPTPESKSATSLGWIDSLENVANGDPLSQPLTGSHAHETFYAKSVVLPQSQLISKTALNNFWSYALNQGRSAPSPWYSIINLYAGQINTPSPLDSAYSHRDALWVVQNYGYTANNQPPWNLAINTFVDGLNNALGSGFSAYRNYVDPSLSAAQAAAKYFGKTTYNRLLTTKNVVDPAMVFWNPQAVGNTGPL